MVIFQRGEPTGKSEQQLLLGKGGLLKIREELQQLNQAPEAIARPIPEELQQLNQSPEAIARPIPGFAVDVDLESYEPDPILTTTANIKDVCWLLTRHYRTPYQSVPAWMGFNQLTITHKQQVSNIRELPTNHKCVRT